MTFIRRKGLCPSLPFFCIIISEWFTAHTFAMAIVVHTIDLSIGIVVLNFIKATL